MVIKVADGTTDESTDEATAEAERLQQEQDAAEETARLQAEADAAAEIDPTTGKPKEKPAASEDDDEVIVAIGDSPTSEDEDDPKFEAAPEWVKDLRKNQRELARENRELKAKAAEREAPAQQEQTLRPKPEIKDHNFDGEAFAADLDKWHEEKAKVDSAKAKKEQESKAEKDAWNAKLNDYKAKKGSLKVKDFEDAEEAALADLSITQQGVVLQGSDNPAIVVYALGKNPKKRKELAAIKDPVKFAFAVAKLETQLKVTKRKAPPPEGKPDGSSAGTSGSVDSELERLRTEAEKTGDLSKVIAYKAKKRSSG